MTTGHWIALAIAIVLSSWLLIWARKYELRRKP